MGTQLTVTISGSTHAELIEGAKKFVAASGAVTTAGAATKAAAAPKKAPVKAAEETEDLLGSDDAGDDSLLGDGSDDAGDDSLSFDATEETPAPAKKKAAKITEKEVNAAAMAHAKANGRPETLKILKSKFKVASLTELKADQYAAFIAALK